MADLRLAGVLGIGMLTAALVASPIAQAAPSANCVSDKFRDGVCQPIVPASATTSGVVAGVALPVTYVATADPAKVTAALWTHTATWYVVSGFVDNPATCDTPVDPALLNPAAPVAIAPGLTAEVVQSTTSQITAKSALRRTVTTAGMAGKTFCARTGVALVGRNVVGMTKLVSNLPSAVTRVTIKAK